jgi:hypothetical protein
MADPFVSEIALEIAEVAEGHVKAYLALRSIRARAIGDSLQILDTGPGSAALYTPYYWAKYFHDGRGPVRARPGHYLVFFLDPRDDPRTSFGTKFPVRRSDVRHLSRDEFLRLLGTPGMIITKEVRGALGQPFFTEPLRDLDAGPIVSRALARIEYPTERKTLTLTI